MLTAKHPLKTIFIGTGEFAIPALKALIKSDNLNIVKVITQPDKPAGRKQNETPPPVKIEAKKSNIPVLQPEKIANIKEKITNIDLIVVIAYAQLISEEILDLPKYGSLNVHASLLPKYRGASCISAAILNGDKKTGISIIMMDASIDTGPILAQKTVNIDPNDTAGNLHDKLAGVTPLFLLDTTKKWINNNITPRPQAKAMASYAPRLTKQSGKIYWARSASYLERFIRAMAPWPSAFTYLNESKNSLVKIISTDSKPINTNRYQVGELFLFKNLLAVQCGNGALIIREMQLSGKKPMAADEFLRGHQGIIGSVFI